MNEFDAIHDERRKRSMEKMDHMDGPPNEYLIKEQEEELKRGYKKPFTRDPPVEAKNIRYVDINGSTIMLDKCKMEKPDASDQEIVEDILKKVYKDETPWFAPAGLEKGIIKGFVPAGIERGSLKDFVNVSVVLVDESHDLKIPRVGDTFKIKKAKSISLNGHRVINLLRPVAEDNVTKDMVEKSTRNLANYDCIGYTIFNPKCTTGLNSKGFFMRDIDIPFDSNNYIAVHQYLCKRFSKDYIFTRYSEGDSNHLVNLFDIINKRPM